MKFPWAKAYRRCAEISALRGGLTAPDSTNWRRHPGEGSIILDCGEHESNIDMVYCDITLDLLVWLKDTDDCPVVR